MNGSKKITAYALAIILLVISCACLFTAWPIIAHVLLCIPAIYKVSGCVLLLFLFLFLLSVANIKPNKCFLCIVAILLGILAIAAFILL